MLNIVINKQGNGYGYICNEQGDDLATVYIISMATELFKALQVYNFLGDTTVEELSIWEYSHHCYKEHVETIQRLRTKIKELEAKLNVSKED